MKGSFLCVVLVFFLFLLHQKGNATRYMPFIVWDHLNPMLRCKCNWFHNMTRMEIYDRFDFICPTTEINVKLLDTSSRPTDQMNENIFQRKWKGTVKELMKEMESGEFCDPNHNDTKKLFTCENGNGDTHMIKLAPHEHSDKAFYKDDIVVFFNNGNDGRVGTLLSKEKKCTMAFVVNVTWQNPEDYDFSYKKELNFDGKNKHWCDKINATCSLPDIRYMVKTQPPKPPIIKYKPQYIIEYLRSPTKHPNDHKFAEGVGVGFAVMLLLALLVFFVIFVRHRRSRREKITQDKGVDNEGYEKATIKR